MIPSWRNKSYEERLALLNIFSPEKCRLRENFIVRFKIFKGFTNVDANKLFSIGELSQRSTNEEQTATVLLDLTGLSV